MANQFRFVRGDVRAVSLPAYAVDAVEIGDLVWWDATNDAVRPASVVSGANYTEKKTNLATAFVGVALSAKEAGRTGQVLVATEGDFLFAAPSGDGTGMEVGQILAGGNGTAMANQTVSAASSTAEVIGVAVASKSTSETAVYCRILSRLSHLGLHASAVGTLNLADGAAILFGSRSLSRSGNNILASLPTTNPGVAGALWNDNGTVKVSAGA
jgi:hypothetical protein